MDEWSMLRYSVSSNEEPLRRNATAIQERLATGVSNEFGEEESLRAALAEGESALNQLNSQIQI